MVQFLVWALLRVLDSAHLWSSFLYGTCWVAGAGKILPNDTPWETFTNTIIGTYYELAL